MQIKIIGRIKHAIITVYYLVHNDSFNAYTGKKKKSSHFEPTIISTRTGFQISA